MSPCRPALALAALLLATAPVEPARPPPAAGRDDDALGALGAHGFISPPSDPDAGPGLSPGEAAWAWTAAGRCPYYCTCLRLGGLRRANCADRRLGSVDLGLPADTEAADLDFNVITVLDDGCFQVALPPYGLPGPRLLVEVGWSHPCLVALVYRSRA